MEVEKHYNFWNFEILAKNAAEKFQIFPDNDLSIFQFEKVNENWKILITPPIFNIFFEIRKLAEFC